MRWQLLTFVWAGALLPGAVVTGNDEDETTSAWSQEDPPKMIVFGDSASDTGRRFHAPASFQFEEYGIGPVPWESLYDGTGTDTKTDAYMPFAGSVTNGKSWPAWLLIPDEHNFATSSATASDKFRSRETCIGYTGDGEEFPTATLQEQVDRYFYEVLEHTDETLDYTHVIFIGVNDVLGAFEAENRYNLGWWWGWWSYVDPVDFSDVFTVDETGVPSRTYEPMIEAVFTAWGDEIDRLITAGVTGRILLANLGSGKVSADDDTTADYVPQALRLRAQQLVAEYPQVRMLDLYTLFAALVDEPTIFTDLGFTAGDGGSLTDGCIQFDFFVDYTAEIMGTQEGRNPDCQQECALCADVLSPCQTCYEGTEPAITKCDDPSTRIFYDGGHFTTEFHRIFGEAIRQCSKDSPDFGEPFVGVLCPAEEA